MALTNRDTVSQVGFHTLHLNLSPSIVFVPVNDCHNLVMDIIGFMKLNILKVIMIIK
jgi:hypothetical protein